MIELVRAERNQEEAEGKKKRSMTEEAQYYHAWGIIEDPLPCPSCLQGPHDNNTFNMINSEDISDVAEEVCCICQKISP